MTSNLIPGVAVNLANHIVLPTDLPGALPETLPIVEYAMGHVFHRVFTESLDEEGIRQYEANEFNDYSRLFLSGGLLQRKLTVGHSGECAYQRMQVHRFSPIIADPATYSERIVPAIYAGTSFNAALSETIFRQHDRVKPKPINRHHLINRYGVQLITNQKIKLCVLTEPYLSEGSEAVFPFSEHEVIQCAATAEGYRRCHEIASAIYHHPDKVDGLFWQSRHMDNTFNLVLWSRGRKYSVSPFDLLQYRHQTTEEPLFEGPGLRKVYNEAARLHIPAARLRTWL
ncbi:MAG: hypothetical protein ACI8WB_005525 [Phenylobacterium sp.]|jgi:hypothetical protein